MDIQFDPKRATENYRRCENRGTPKLDPAQHNSSR